MDREKPIEVFEQMIRKAERERLFEILDKLFKQLWSNRHQARNRQDPKEVYADEFNQLSSFWEQVKAHLQSSE